MISTHTLTWSVTGCTTSVGTNGGISTHTLTWSVTTKSKFSGICTLDFNSHAHVERDAHWINKVVEKFDFNSHAHVERDAHLSAS